jgi:FkbM family methyltransferase
MGLIEAIDCDVYAFDPTPMAIDWIARQTLPQKFHFYPLGLCSMDEEAEFQIPAETAWGHVFSISADPRAKQTGRVMRCPVRRISTLMAQFGHDYLDLIKMDIEGFEYAALADMIATAVRPKMLLVEFHHGCFGISAEKTRSAVSRLTDYGYGIFWVSDVGREYGFLDLHSLC